LKKNLIPKYAHIKIPEYNEAAIKTTQAQVLRIQNEIKFLYIKKEHLNKQLYHIHIHNANIWQKTWNNIEEAINYKLQHEMKITHLKQQQKINNMETIQTTRMRSNNQQHTSTK
jgi:hypothetical protein